MSRWLLPVLAAAVVLVSLGRLGEQAALVGELWGRSEGERGRIAADEVRSFTARAGRLRLRERLKTGDGASPPSAIASRWNWAYRSAEIVDDRSRVYVNVADPSALFFASFFWHPARVLVDSGGHPITGLESMQRHLRIVDSAELSRLRAAGYTHVVMPTAEGGLGLLAFPPGTGER